jgi:hypothetical protein
MVGDVAFGVRATKYINKNRQVPRKSENSRIKILFLMIQCQNAF